MRTQNPSDLLSKGQQKISVVARDSVYSDLDLLFIPNPVTGDINPIKDIEAIKKSVINLILTNFYERPFQPEIGCGVRGLLFEPADPITISDLEDAAKEVLENFEPRVRVLQVSALDDPDNNAYTMTIYFQILSTEQVAEVTTVLERLR
jgi:phage baseplate assembly protein W